MLEIEPQREAAWAYRGLGAPRSWNHARNSLTILIEVRKRIAQETLFRGDHRHIDNQEEDRQQHRKGPAEQRHGKSRGNEDRAEIERIARPGVGPRLRQFPVLLHVAGCVAPQPETRHHQREAPGDGAKIRRMAPEFDQVYSRCAKTERHADAARDPLPAGDPVRLAFDVARHRDLSPASNSSAASRTSAGSMVSRPASGASRRVWSRRLSGFRSTLKWVPNGPLRLGAVGP